MKTWSTWEYYDHFPCLLTCFNFWILGFESGALVKTTQSTIIHQVHTIAICKWFFTLTLNYPIKNGSPKMAEWCEGNHFPTLQGMTFQPWFQRIGFPVRMLQRRRNRMELGRSFQQNGVGGVVAARLLCCLVECVDLLGLAELVAC